MKGLVSEFVDLEAIHPDEQEDLKLFLVMLKIKNVGIFKAVSGQIRSF
jgi:hypothetical protein